MKIDLFLLGLATIPFDNLPFAPTRGWAAISPIIFWAYCVFNTQLFVRAVTQHHYLYLVYMSGAMAYQFILVMIHGIHVNSFFDGIRGLALGLTVYFAMVIRYEMCHADVNRDAKVLYKAYLVSFIYGVIWVIVSKVSPGSINFYRLLEARHYTRLAYTFTEPSFIGVHTMGVIFLFSYLLRNTKLATKFVRLGFAFMILSIITASSARCALDLIVIVMLLFVRNIVPPPPEHAASSRKSGNEYKPAKKKSKSVLRKIIINIAIVFVIIAVLLMSARLYAVAQRGTDGDGSAGSRWFIVNASLIGYANKGAETLMGWGMGNLNIPFKAGVHGAYKAAGNRFPGDAGGYASSSELDYAICLPVKLISEWGLLLTIIAFLCIVFKCMKRKIDIYVVILICYVYIQFDSYPFYSFWILLYLANYYDPDRHGVSFFEMIS